MLYLALGMVWPFIKTINSTGEGEIELGTGKGVMHGERGASSKWWLLYKSVKI